ncbi:hypothetical protein BGX29_001348, partial [Mortierella sp. GBA35]
MTSTQRRPSGKDEPEDLRRLRREHGGSLATLKELFADWSEEDLLYAIQDAGGDVEAAILRISEGLVTQWGEVKGKKKTPKPKTAHEFRGPSQRGGFADRGSRGRGDGFRGGRGGSTRGAPRAQNGGDRNTRPAKTEDETPSWPSITAEKAEGVVDEAPSWAKITASSVSTTSHASDGRGATPSWGTPAEETKATPAAETTTVAESTTVTDPWGDAASNPPLPSTSTRKVNTSTIPTGNKMSWAKIVKPEPAPQPAPPKVIPASASAPEAQKESKPVEPVPEPVVEKEAEPESEPEVEATPVPEETPEVKEVEPEVIETAPEPVEEEKKKEEPEPVPEPVAETKVEKEPEHTPAPEKTTAPTATPTGPPGLKQKPAHQPRRLNQDVPVVIAGGSTSLQTMGLKFGSFSLNDNDEPETEAAEAPEAPVEEPAQPAPAETQPAQPVQPTPQPTQQPAQQQPSTYGRQPAAAATAATTTNQAVPAASGQSPATANAYAKQDPAANYLAQHHHHPAMGLDAMGSPYGSYMPGANQLGSFGMAPMASLPNDYSALYGNDIQRAMYYDPVSYGQMPATGINSYQARDTKYNQDSAAAVGTTGAGSTGSTQAQQTLQQQQQQAYPNMGGMPYYPYYYMPNQFPTAYQQSGYGQPFVNKNMYPMYQHQQQQQQHGSNKPGSNNNTPYGNYNSSGTGQGGHHQYSQSGYDDMSGAGLHGGMSLGSDSYTKYGYPGTQNFLGSQQGATPTSTAGSAKGNTGSGNYNGADKNSATGAQPSNAAGGASLQGQQGSMNQGQQGYYQQQ